MNNNLYFNELFNQNGISLIKIKDKDFQNFLDFPILIHHKKNNLLIICLIMDWKLEPIFILTVKESLIII